MKIIHTADWHLGDHLGPIDRTDDGFRAIERIMACCDEHDADVLLVAGDVIEDYHGDTLTRLVARLAALLRPRMERGMHAVFIPGNHDREHLFQLVETMQALSGSETTRRIHVSGHPRTLTLPDPSGAFAVQFVLAPYPTAHRYLPSDGGTRLPGAAEKRRVLAHAFADYLTLARSALDPLLPAILVAHATVQGAETSSRFRLGEAEDIVVEARDLPAWTYVALGHIHKPQAIGGHPTVRYAGSPDRLDGGERDDDKSCVLIKVDRAGLVGEPQLLPLPATPIYSVRIDGETDMDALAVRYPDRERALVGLQVGYRPGVDNPHALVTRARALFPRAYKLDMQPLAGMDEPDGPDEPAGARVAAGDARDLGGTVRAYVERRLGAIAPEARARVLKLAMDTVQEVRDAAAAH